MRFDFSSTPTQRFSLQWGKSWSIFINIMCMCQWTRAQFDGALLRSIRERSNLQRWKNERKVSTTNRMEEFLVVNSNSFKKIAFDFTLIASEWTSEWMRETRTTNKTFPFWFINSHQFLLRCQHMHGTSRRSFTAKQVLCHNEFDTTISSLAHPIGSSRRCSIIHTNLGELLNEFFIRKLLSTTSD